MSIERNRLKKITINDISIDVVRKEIKNIHLAVYPPKGRVRIAAPLAMEDEAVRLFAISKLGWIKRHRRKFSEQDRITPREFKNRESHYYQGHRYLLKVIERDARQEVVLKNRTYVELYIRPGTSTAIRHKIMNEWYRKELKKQVPELVKKWEKIIDIKVDEWQIRIMKTKWGSCSRDRKKIILNLELAKKPKHCLEYIIVHEMTHLLERHHNQRFLTLMDKYYPQWKKIKNELNRLPVSYADWDN